MSQTAKFVATVTALIIGAVAIGGFELHRHFLAFVWPLFTDFWFTYIAF